MTPAAPMAPVTAIATATTVATATPVTTATALATAALTSRTELPGNALAAAAARAHLRAALAEWAGWGAPGTTGMDERLVDDAVLLVSELVTNAVLHARTAVDVACRLEPGSRPGEPFGLVVEVSDRHPSRTVQIRSAGGYGHGLCLVDAIAESWGVTHRVRSKTVWFRLPLIGSAPPAAGGPAATEEERVPRRGLLAAEILGPVPRSPDPEPITQSALSFLAEASDLLAGQTDEDQVVALAAQLAVPRLADWCAVWRESTAAGPPRPVSVRHVCEERVEELRTALEKQPPAPDAHHGGAAMPWPWPGPEAAYGPGGAALACRLVFGDRPVGTLLIGWAGLLCVSEDVTGLIEDFARRLAQAMTTARRYTRQATISRVLQRGLLPSGVARIPGVDTAVVYEPAGEDAWAGGDFYDVFDAGGGRWGFALGDVCGNGPEAAVVTGLARPVLRALAREGHGVAATLDGLNREVGEQARFLSLLYGELAPTERGRVRCTLASAGHPLPLLLGADGRVRAAARPQLLLGVVEDATYESESFGLGPGDTLLCVTDGVTERRSGRRQFDDGDGLASALAGCAGLGAAAVAERIRQAVHGFSADPPTDDLALLVLQPTPAHRG